MLAGAGLSLQPEIRSSDTKALWIAGFLAGSAALISLVMTLVLDRDPGASIAMKDDSRPTRAPSAAIEIPQLAVVPAASNRVRPAGEPTLLFRVVDDATGNGVASARLTVQRVVN